MRKRKYFTEAERKEAKRISAAKSYAKHREARRISAVKHYAKNREAILIEQAKYYQANKEQRNAKSKAYYESTKLDHWVIYCLHNYDGLNNHYVGQTQNPHKRIADHKTLGKDTEGFLVLDYADTKVDALFRESQYHNKGYHGAIGYESKLKAA